MAEAEDMLSGPRMDTLLKEDFGRDIVSPRVPPAPALPHPQPHAEPPSAALGGAVMPAVVPNYGEMGGAYHGPSEAPPPHAPARWPNPSYLAYAAYEACPPLPESYRVLPPAALAVPPPPLEAFDAPARRPRREGVPFSEEGGMGEKYVRRWCSPRATPC